MKLLNETGLAQKLRISTALLLGCVLLGSLLAYMKMRQVSEMSARMAQTRVPALTAVRDLRAAETQALTALKSYMLFGVDPAMAAHYRAQIGSGLANGNAAEERIQALRSTLNEIAGKEKVDALLAEYRAVVAGEDQVEKLAVGQGAEATGNAYDLLQGSVAAHDAIFQKEVAEAIGDVVRVSDADLNTIVQINRREALILWLAVLIGGVFGGVFSELSLRRVVRSVVMVAERAKAIAEGDLTGDALQMDSNDEVTSLARSINRMQDNLREMIRTMAEIAGSVTGSAAQLTSSSADSFQRTKEQSLQTQQAAAAMQEMSISIAEVSRHAQNAAGSARHAATTAREGGAIVGETLANMQSIAASVRNTAETVQRLGKESEQIIRIVNVIEEIAQKTNLLALNATIEAARAGEQGRGFAVVAGEVRRLAESTRNATNEIAQMVQGIQAHTRGAVEAMQTGTVVVGHGVETTQRAGESLQQIIQMADQVDQMIAQIATASMQQAEAARQSSENVDVINRLGEESAASIPETTKMVHAVESGAKRLQDHIGRFRLEEMREGARASYTGSAFAQPAPAYGD